MKLRALIAVALAAARHRTMAPFAVMVFAAALVGSAFAAIWMMGAVRLSYHSSSGIVGWITSNHYAKPQEVFNLMVAVVGLPTGLWAGWWAWVLGAAWGARLAGCAPARLLKQLALAGIGLFALVPALARLEAPSPRPLLVALAGVTFAGFLLVIFNRRFGVKHASLLRDTVPEQAAEAPSSPTRAPWPRSWRIAKGVLLWIILPALIYALSFENRINLELDYYNQFHEGERLYPMWSMRHGGVPYHDAYLQHGLFRNAVVPQVGAMLFGPTLEGVRRIENIVWPLGVLSVYLAGVTLLGSHLVSVLVLTLFLLSWRVQIPERLFFAGLSIAVMATAMRRSRLWNLLRPPNPRDRKSTRRERLTRFLRQGWPLMLSGALASMAFWSSVDSGLFVLAGMGAFLTVVAVLGPGRGVATRLGPLVAFGAGAFVGFGVVALYFVANGALGDLIRNVYQQCAYQTETWGLPFPSLFEASPLSVRGWGDFLRSDTALMYFPFLTLLLAEAWLVWLWVHGRLWTSSMGWQLLMVTCVGLCFARGLLGRSDDQHLYNGLFSQLLVGALALDATLGFLRKHIDAFRTGYPSGSLASPLLAVILLALTANFLGDTYRPLASAKQRAREAREKLVAGFTRSSSPPEPFPGAGRISVPEADVERARRVVDFIREHTQPGEAIVNFSSHATLMFFADRPSATHYFLPCYAPTQAMQREAIAEIEQHQPRLAYRGLGHGFDDQENAQRQGLIHEYLEAHYEPIGKVEDIEFLWRKGAKP